MATTSRHYEQVSRAQEWASQELKRMREASPIESDLIIEASRSDLKRIRQLQEKLMYNLK